MHTSRCCTVFTVKYRLTPLTDFHVSLSLPLTPCGPGFPGGPGGPGGPEILYPPSA